MIRARVRFIPSMSSSSKLSTPPSAALVTAVDTAVNMAKAEYNQTQAGNEKKTANLDVTGWEFVSPYAINQEYVESQTMSASIV